MPKSSRDRLRLLFLLPHVPGLEAASGGARSTAQLIHGLANRHDVAVLCLRRSHDGATDPILRGACHVYEEFEQAVPVDSNPWQRLRRLALPLLFTPKWALNADVPSCRRRLRSLAMEWRPDVVHLAYHVMGQYADELDGCPAPLVLTQHEPGVTAARDAARHGSGLRRLLRQLEVGAWARYERRVMRKVEAVVVFTESDRRALASLAKGVRIFCIPLSTTVPLVPLDPVGRPASMLFVGNFMHRPNVDGALWLMRSIFPRIRRARPDAQLIVAGAGPTDEITSMAGGPITVTGAVDSLVPFLDAAAVIVAPLRDGGGMRVKLLEALAAGKAVVASPLAASGLNVQDGRELSIAEGEVQFAAEVVRLLDDPVARVDLARGARTWACAHLGWESSVEKYEALHRELLMVGAGSSGSTGGDRSLKQDRAVRT